MKDVATVEETKKEDELRAGKGYRTALTSDMIAFQMEVWTTINEAWDACDTPREVLDALKETWGTYGNDKYGERVWAAIRVHEDELRIAVVLHKGRNSVGPERLAIDYREFYMPH
jgi:hypothetical protein